ncbi:hypothetical protein [Thermoactinomyces mirandus]|uniref:hypothetical protein n=1 Tax=Thermoactinomyces mirandus TaxID=2756294 RepID=UPI001C68ED4E|nr:hypothetical protein [Thermoactinomyces mirandus]
MSAKQRRGFAFEGPSLFVGYLKRLDTGDRAVIDQDGYIRIVGRNKDVIIRGGENISVVKISCMNIRISLLPRLWQCRIPGYRKKLVCLLV